MKLTPSGVISFVVVGSTYFREIIAFFFANGKVFEKENNYFSEISLIKLVC